MSLSVSVVVRSTIVMLVLGFLALAGIVGTTLWLVEQNRAWFEQTTDSREIRSAAIALRSALQDAETGQRGYLLTGEQRYLEPYERSVGQIPALIDRLATVFAPFPEQARAIAKMRTAVAGKLEELSRTIELVRDGHRDEAVAIVLTDEGKVAMDEARALFDQLIDVADQRIDDGVVNQANAADALRWVTIVGAFVIVAVAAGAIWMAMTYTRELSAARQEVVLANAGLEERVRERTADLGRANDEIQRFAYIVTHDLRAPLVNIMGFTSELETSVGELERYIAARGSDDDDPELRAARVAATEDLPEAIGFIRAATRKMDGLINAILRISREGRRQLKPETLDVKAIAEAAVASVQHQIVEGGGAATIDATVRTIVSDRLSLEQALGNLLDNAIKYRDPGRPLQIVLRAAAAPGNRVAIDVEDNGRGISPADHERVFELFRRAGSLNQPGEGIGLAYVRTIARSLGGDVTLRSELGKGSTFTITLPRDLRRHLEAKST